ncbi:MAG TPA: Gfo/Idh/MocA family oxidoreductase [Candidatus Hydrogenedentes bacterium]|jgi:predicted dehydrogenase|nr:Gfo/Idh/MocA family oxidoreductase [Candidatus Hydrogenedentota bacterium]HOD96280.1 Gfo/Idh/MocA family oxidoreductase [Candidatus Hydrogenedentota bacterium]HOH42016.1 Gfo/Idh/MocA family oxidoreductase [Candidatus Hydrogenedentota bacterium]HOR51727.1 Gfo/Idh/MocA family oxidoreductase [Candidatus Hydrogenedentota bacterium]HPK25704.1 Gfo/Idh/MocA family oxidoreductase [Candidatus Hydrogenedentota bacterium]
MSKHTLTRRAFLSTATTTALVAGYASGNPLVNTARVIPRKLSPNERLNIASIGVGGMGHGDVMKCRSENIVALCDVDFKRAEETFYRLPKAKQYKDFRVMLEEMDKEIDAVTVSTPDHIHAPAAYLAMTMGKHVRVQKPMTQTIAEARLLAKTAKETGVVTAMGNQGHSGNGIREMCEIIWSGAIGQIRESHTWTDRPIWPQGIANRPAAQPVPEHLDWDLWLGPAPWREYSAEYLPFNWRGWLDFGCGAIGDMACHIVDPVFWALKLYEAPSYTVEVVQQTGLTQETFPNSSIIKYEFPARGDMDPVTVYWYDGGLLPKRPEGVPENEKLGDGENGSLFIGTDGVLTTGTYGGDTRMLPAERMKDFTMPTPTLERIPDENPYMHWINACKNGTEAVSPFSYAGPLTEFANMGNVALLAGAKIEFDVASMTITNNAAANQFLTKSYRKGFDFMPL